MSEQAKHTVLDISESDWPGKRIHCITQDSTGLIVAGCPTEELAAFVVKCLRNHDALLEACKFAKAQIKRQSPKKALPILRAAIANTKKEGGA